MYLPLKGRAKFSRRHAAKSNRSQDFFERQFCTQAHGRDARATFAN